MRLAVGLLADEIAGCMAASTSAGRPFTKLDVNDRRSRSCRQRLKRLGYYDGKIDGKIGGSGSQAAITAFQARRQGLTQDGHPSMEVLDAPPPQLRSPSRRVGGLAPGGQVSHGVHGAAHAGSRQIMVRLASCLSRRGWCCRCRSLLAQEAAWRRKSFRSRGTVVRALYRRREKPPPPRATARSRPAGPRPRSRATSPAARPARRREARQCPQGPGGRRFPGRRSGRRPRAAAFAKRPASLIVDRTNGSSGFVRDDFYNWPERDPSH